jgi:hypothetical protein
MKFRLLLVAVLFGTVVYGDDNTFQLGDGRILIKDAQFIRENVFGGGALVPELSFTIINETSFGWRSVKLKFDMSGICGSKPRQWSRSVVMSLGWTQQEHYAKEFKDTMIALVGKVDGCHTETIKASLLNAEKVSAAEAVDQGIRDAAEAARQKRATAEQKKAVEERALVRAACAMIYKNTSDKKMSDLTVNEDQQVKTCQAVGLYPPR